MDNATNRFVVTTGPHGMPSLQLYNPSAHEREFVRAAVMCCWIDSPAYRSREGSGAFLQSDHNDYVLVEFWQNDYEPFIDYLNDNFDEWVTLHEGNFGW